MSGVCTQRRTPDQQSCSKWSLGPVLSPIQMFSFLRATCSQSAIFAFSLRPLHCSLSHLGTGPASFRPLLSLTELSAERNKSLLPVSHNRHDKHDSYHTFLTGLHHLTYDISMSVTSHYRPLFYITNKIPPLSPFHSRNFPVSPIVLYYKQEGGCWHLCLNSCPLPGSLPCPVQPPQFIHILTCNFTASLTRISMHVITFPF